MTGLGLLFQASMLFIGLIILLLACSPKHPLANESAVDIHRLQFERFIAFEKEVPTRTWIDAILGRYSTVVRPVMEFDNIETIKRSVEIGAGVSIVPFMSIQKEVQNESLFQIHFTDKSFYRPLGIIVRRKQSLSRAARKFIELMQKPQPNT